MIAVDTSAIMAIAFEEAEAKLFSALLGASAGLVGGPTLAEALVVAEGRVGLAGAEIVRQMIVEELLVVTPFTERHAAAAHEAHRRFGKGRGHPAKLNICDCFSYAIAACDDLPLLFKGDDFVHTDIRPAYLP